MDEREKKRRLFVGIALDDATRAACAAVAQRLQATGFTAKYEGAGKLHVTLAFLGNVAAPHDADVDAALDTAAARGAPLTLTLDKIGAFPHERKPRVVYIGAREQRAPFRELARGVRDAYTVLGFKFEDDPVAHVTIARVKEPRAPLRSIEFAPIAFAVDSLSLFESVFDPWARTSRYRVARTAQLSPPAS